MRIIAAVMRRGHPNRPYLIDIPAGATILQPSAKP